MSPIEEELNELRQWRIAVTSALRREGGSFYEDVPRDIRALRDTLDRQKAEYAELASKFSTVRAACRVSSKGFDERVFVWSMARDQNPRWAIELIPYIQALKTLHDVKSDEADEEQP